MKHYVILLLAVLTLISCSDDDNDDYDEDDYEEEDVEDEDYPDEEDFNAAIDAVSGGGGNDE